jgi:hypothetical protein
MMFSFLLWQSYSGCCGTRLSALLLLFLFVCTLSPLSPFLLIPSLLTLYLPFQHTPHTTPIHDCFLLATS